MTKSLLTEIFRRPLGAFSFLLLGLLYGSALLAPFLAPQTYQQQRLKSPYHPPTKIFYENGAWRLQKYQRTDLATATYSPIPQSSAPLCFFAPGPRYSLLGGILQWDRHLIQSTDPEVPLYLLGSDSTGRDVLSRLLYGSRVSLTLGIIGLSITMIMGFLIGGLSGYYGGFYDNLSMRLVEFLIAIPGLYLLLALRSSLSSYFNSQEMMFLIVAVLAFVGWPGTARILRGMTLSLRNRSFVHAAESMGQSTGKILTKHILPNLLSYLLVTATLSIPGYILGEAALSFLGLGIQEPYASWGLMLSQAQGMKVFKLNFWWLLTPGLLIFLTVLSFNLLGDVLTDIVNPKEKSRT